MRLAARVRAWLVGPDGSPTPAALLLASTAVFVFAWFFRYNDPEGEYAGLTDDHYFYLVRGWQMLFGELPDRDYVDPGAPLAFLMSAAMQVWLGRSIWSEHIFSVTALALAAAATCGAAVYATRSVTLGMAAALFEIALLPRLYNYPKVLVYAVAIPVLWAWVTRPGTRRMWAVAVVTALGFLLRHDHGVYVAVAFTLAVVARHDLGWRRQVRAAFLYGVTVLLILSPYLVYLQVNGGVLRHFATAYRWSERDRDRAPLVLPSWGTESTNPVATPQGWWQEPPVAMLLANYEWWLFWLLTLLPVVALLLLAVAPSTGPPARGQDRLRIVVLVALAVVINDGFLRGNLAVRFGDVATPAAVLGAWTLATVIAIVRRGRIVVGPREVAVGGVVRGALAVSTLAIALLTALVVTPALRDQINKTSLLNGPRAIVGDAFDVTARLRSTWPLDTGPDADERPSMQLARYFEACTAPTDRILVTPYLPVSIALAQRAFAGGHGDLRPGFFDTEADQELTIERLRRQAVPVVVGPRGEELADFARNLPLISSYLAREYVNVGERDLGRGVVIELLVRRDARVVRTYEPLSFPCFR